MQPATPASSLPRRISSRQFPVSQSTSPARSAHSPYTAGKPSALPRRKASESSISSAESSPATTHSTNTTATQNAYHSAASWVVVEWPEPDLVENVNTDDDESKAIAQLSSTRIRTLTDVTGDMPPDSTPPPSRLPQPRGRAVSLNVVSPLSPSLGSKSASRGFVRPSGGGGVAGPLSPLSTSPNTLPQADGGVHIRSVSGPNRFGFSSLTSASMRSAQGPPPSARGLQINDFADVRSPPLLELGTFDAARDSHPFAVLHSAGQNGGAKPPQGALSTSPSLPALGSAKSPTTTPWSHDTAGFNALAINCPPRSETRTELVDVLIKLVGGQEEVRYWGIDPQVLLSEETAVMADLPGSPTEMNGNGFGIGGTRSTLTNKASRDSALWFATGLPSGNVVDEESEDDDARTASATSSSPKKLTKKSAASSSQTADATLVLSPAGSTRSGILGRFGWRSKSSQAGSSPTKKDASGSKNKNGNASAAQQAASSVISNAKRNKSTANVKSGRKAGSSAQAPFVSGSPRPVPTESPSQKKNAADKANTGVMGVALHETNKQASCVTIIGGQRHILPIIVFSTVEDVYKRGMKMPGLLRIAGDLARTEDLIAMFSTPPSYGDRHDVSNEDVHSLCGVLKRYLRALPHPLLGGALGHIFWKACVQVPTSSDQTALRGQIKTATALTTSSPRKIAIAQCILRLLPVRWFSLLVYVTAFLSQIPLFPENRLTLDSLATILGPALLAGRNVGLPGLGRHVASASISSINTQNGADGQNKKFEAGQQSTQGLLWLLRNWNEVTDGLLEETFSIDVDQLVANDFSPSIQLRGNADHENAPGSTTTTVKEWMQTPMTENVTRDRLDSVFESYGSDSEPIVEDGRSPPATAMVMEDPIMGFGAPEEAGGNGRQFHGTSATTVARNAVDRYEGHVQSHSTATSYTTTTGATSSRLSGSGVLGRGGDDFSSRQHKQSESSMSTVPSGSRMSGAMGSDGHRGSFSSAHYKSALTPFSPVYARSPVPPDALTSPNEILDVLSDLIKSRDMIIQGQAHRITESDAQVVETQSRISSYENELNELRQHLASRSDELNHLRLDMKKMKQVLESKRDQVNQLQDQVNDERDELLKTLREKEQVEHKWKEEEVKSSLQREQLEVILKKTKAERDEHEQKVEAVKQALGVLEASKLL